MPAAFSEDDEVIVKHVFHVYADVATHRVSNSNFRRLTMDAPNLLTSWFGLVDVDLAYAQARGHSCRRLDVTQFVEALVFLAWRKYPEEAEQNAFLRLLNESIYLLPVAPKSAHARAAEFAVARLGQSANQPHTIIAMPTFLDRDRNVDDILYDIEVNGKHSLHIDEPGDPADLGSMVQLEPMPIWPSDEARVQHDIKRASVDVVKVAMAGYLLATLRAVGKSHQRAQCRQAFQIWNDVSTWRSRRLLCLATLVQVHRRRHILCAWKVWTDFARCVETSQHLRTVTMSWAKERQRHVVLSILKVWRQTVDDAKDVRAQFRRIWKHRQARQLRSRWMQWRWSAFHRRSCSVVLRGVLRLRRKAQVQRAWWTWYQHSARLATLNCVVWKSWKRTTRTVYMVIFAHFDTKRARSNSLHTLMRRTATKSLSAAWTTWVAHWAIHTLLMSGDSRRKQRLTARAVALWRKLVALRQLQNAATKRLGHVLRRHILAKALVTLRKAYWFHQVHAVNTSLKSANMAAMMKALYVTLWHLWQRHCARSFATWRLQTFEDRRATQQRRVKALARLAQAAQHRRQTWDILQQGFRQWRCKTNESRDSSLRDAALHHESSQRRLALAYTLLRQWLQRHRRKQTAASFQSTQALVHASQKQAALMALAKAMQTRCIRQWWHHWYQVVNSSSLWQVHWSRDASSYYVCNTLTGLSLWTCPRGSALVQEALNGYANAHAIKAATSIHRVWTRQQDQLTAAQLRTALSRWRALTLEARVQSHYEFQAAAHIAETHALMEAQVTSCYDTSCTLLQQVRAVLVVFGQWKTLWTESKGTASMVVAIATSKRCLRQLVKVVGEWKRVVFLLPNQDTEFVVRSTCFDGTQSSTNAAMTTWNAASYILGLDDGGIAGPTKWPEVVPWPFSGNAGRTCGLNELGEPGDALLTVATVLGWLYSVWKADFIVEYVDLLWSTGAADCAS
ncbi:hypothetical protein H310_02060 [Aphanomyces invadans]|uniref:WW domain-containing protein n=1 Tax=Aphanomyces invadans TaxID=157072 RepID=A0A024UM91_9STRA|nr:hypothetical protein H310_02060 [Aphanomyces invadans]ETW07576.1 hypothetical protein H310_02060 [Aphanomyces invadans]|eukprot:XP_008863669.1 hypothetical protein H310_02060 [Aphanomyces invadans]